MATEEHTEKETDHTPAPVKSREIPSTAPVLIAGGGPVGLVTALTLARHGIRSILAERNMETTHWPKMDLTNCRSMELLKRLGLDDGLRKQGVAQEYPLDILFSTGLGEGGELIAKWELLSNDAWREKIARQNDGTLPRQPYQRCSQVIFEAWMRKIVEEEPLIDAFWGLKFDSLTETKGGVKSILTDMVTGEERTVESQYVVGADGAGSRVRRSVGLKSIGGPLPMGMHLVHFQSRDMAYLHKFGRFWHLFLTSNGWLLSQDEIDTYTAHMPIPADIDQKTLDPMVTLRKVLGGSAEECPIKVDRILVASTWRPSLGVTDKYRSENGRVFLAGDSAHQTTPIGGYGMNMGLADAFDIAWKLSAVIKGYGGEHLLASYDVERRPVALRNVETAGRLTELHTTYWGWVEEATPSVLVSNTDEGLALRSKIRDVVLAHDDENQLQGLEMGYRYNASPVIFAEDPKAEPEFNTRHYVPTTWPGSRPPHVFLSDGKTSTFDLFGSGFTVFDFTPDGTISSAFAAAATKHAVPLERVHLPNEPHVRKLWERDVVLIRPDDHVAWRLPDGASEADVERILRVAVGQEAVKRDTEHAGEMPNGDTLKDVKSNGGEQKAFRTTIGNVDQDTTDITLLASWQKTESA